MGVDLVVVNEIEYLHWRGFKSESLAYQPTYLDLHEDHVNTADRGPLERFAFRKYWKWQLSQLETFVSERRKNIAITSIEEAISESYSQLLGEPIGLIYNAPDQNFLMPTKVDPSLIKLVHHGMGTKGRGIEETIKALKALDSRFTLDLILFATPQFKLKIKFLIVILGVSHRVRILPGVPLVELPTTLNRYDVSVILAPPITQGNWNALPNKFFESIQAKLAVITGPNPSMKRIVEHSGIGIALESWRFKDLANCLANLSPGRIENFKDQSIAASELYSTVQSRKVFIETLGKVVRSTLK